MGKVAFTLLNFTKTEWTTWSASHTLAPGRLALVIDTAEVAVQNAVSEISRDYSRAIELWIGDPLDSKNTLLYAHEDVKGHIVSAHIESIDSFNESDPSADPTPSTRFKTGVKFDYEEAILFVKQFLGFDGEITIESLGKFADTVDTTYRLPVGYITINSENVASRAVQNKTVFYQGVENGDDILNKSDLRFVTFNPVTGCEFVGEMREGLTRDTNYIGLPFDFTRNSTPYNVPIWEFTDASNILKFSDSKPAIFQLSDLSETQVLTLTANQNDVAIDLTELVSANDSIYIIDPANKKWKKLKIVSRTSTAITVKETIANPFGETVYLNVWIDGPDNLGDVTRDGLVRLASTISADNIESAEAIDDTHHGSVDIEGVSFPKCFKTVGRISIHDVNTVGFDVADPDNYEDSWLIVETIGGVDVVTGIRQIRGIVTNNTEDNARLSNIIDSDSLDKNGTLSGIIPGQTYILPLSEREVASRFTSIPAMLISGIVRNSTYLQINFENTVPVTTFQEWLKAFNRAIYDGNEADTFFLALAHRAAVLEAGLIRGKNSLTVSGTTVNKIIYTSGLRITNEPDHLRIDHTPGLNDTSAWEDEIDPTSVSNSDKLPDVYNPRDSGAFTIINTDQIGTAASQDVDIQDLRYLRAQDIKPLENNRIGFFEADSFGDGVALSISETQGVKNIATATSSVIIPTVVRSSVGNAKIYEIRLGSESDLDPYRSESSFPPSNIAAKQVSTDELVVVRIPSEFEATAMADRHSSNADAYEDYQIKIATLRVGWSFILALPDLGRIKAPHANTRVTLQVLAYNPQTIQTQYPRTDDEGNNIVGTRGDLIYRYLDESTKKTKVSETIILFSNSNVNSSTGIDPDKRLASPEELLKRIPEWPLLFRITCVAADPNAVRMDMTRLLVEPLTALSLIPTD